MSDDESNNKSRYHNSKTKLIGGNTHDATVTVILTGPFTSDQKAVTLKSLEVNSSRCKNALKWSKVNDRLCENVDVDEKIATPIIIDCPEKAMSSNLNTERTITWKTIFTDDEHMSTLNGGVATEGEFEAEVIKNLTSKKSKLIARPTSKIVKDCDGDGLLEAHILQFPHGVGTLVSFCSSIFVF